MRLLDRRLPVSVTATCAAALTGLLLVAPPAASAKGHHPPGRIGTSINLAHAVSFHGIDVATNSKGTAYIGWISAGEGDKGRLVHLCTMRVGSRKCAGGIQTVSAVDPVTAADLRVLVTSGNLVHLLWFHETANSISGPNESAIAQATAPNGRNLSAPTDVVTNAPSHGQLLAAENSPGGEIWTVEYRGVGTKNVVFREGLSSNGTTIPVPYDVGYAHLAFVGGKAVLSVDKYGTVSDPLQYANLTLANDKWSSFQPLNHSRVTANSTLTTTSHGLRAITGANNPLYRQMVAKWTGSKFARPRLTADHSSCTPSTNDSSSDPSGRLLNASWECGKVTVANYADAFHAAITRFKAIGVPTDAPQIDSGTRGIATVAYTTEPTTGSGPRHIWVAHVRLPDSTHTVHKSSKAGRVTVTGPRSCLPPVNTHIGWSHHAAKHWAFSSGALKLNGNKVTSGTLDGANLKPGKLYTLAGSATFSKNGAHRHVTAKLQFRSCGTG